jgi:hypothetical protein
MQKIVSPTLFVSPTSSLQELEGGGEMKGAGSNDAEVKVDREKIDTVQGDVSLSNRISTGCCCFSFLLDA